MTETKAINLTLPRQQADALAAVAGGAGGSTEKLAAWIVGEWIGRLPVDRTPANKMAVAINRLAILQRWWKLRKQRGMSEAEATARLIARMRREGERASRTSLHDWELRWKVGGVAALIDSRNTRASMTVQTPFIARVVELLKGGRGRSLSSCYRVVADASGRRDGEPIPSYKTVWRIIRKRR